MNLQHKKHIKYPENHFAKKDNRFIGQTEIYLIVILLTGLFLMLLSKPYYMFTVSDAYENADQAYHLFIGDGLYLKYNGVLSESVQGPGYPIIISLFFMLFGVSDNVVMFTSIFFSLFLIFLTFLLGKELFSPKEGLIASFILILSPLFLIQSVASQNDMTAAFFSSSTVFLTLRFIRTSKYIYFWFSMFALNFSFLAKYPHILIGILILAILLYKRQNIDFKKCFVIFAISFVLIVVPFLYSNYNNHNNILPYAYQFYEKRGDSGISNIVPNLSQIFSYFFMNNNYHEYTLWYNQVFPLFFLIGLICLIANKSHLNRMLFLILGLWFAIFAGFFSVFVFVDVRYFLPLLVPMSIIIAYGCTFISSKINNKKFINFFMPETEAELRKKSKKRKITEETKTIDHKYTYSLSILVLILIFSSVSYLPDTIRGTNSRIEWSYIKEAGLFIKENTPDNSIIMSLYPYALDFYSNREVITLETDTGKIFYMQDGLRKNISQLLDVKYPLYAVQVNSGYRGWMARENIISSYEAIYNVSKSYNVILIKEMPQFILYKIIDKINE